MIWAWIKSWGRWQLSHGGARYLISHLTKGALFRLNGNPPSVFICKTAWQQKPNCGLVYYWKECQELWNPFRPRLKTSGPSRCRVTAEEICGCLRQFLGAAHLCLRMDWLQRRSAEGGQQIVKLYSRTGEQIGEMLGRMNPRAELLIMVISRFDLHFVGKKLSVQRLAVLAFAKRAGN